MKTVVTINKGKAVTLERYENELKVGERMVSFELFLKGLLAECNTEFLLSYLVDREVELKMLFSAANKPLSYGTSEYDVFKNFIRIMLESLKIVQQDEWIQDLGMTLLKNLNASDESKQLSEQLLLSTFAKNNYRLEENETLLTLIQGVIQALMRSDNPNTRALIAQYVLQHLEEAKEKEAIEDWYRFVLAKVELSILAEESKKRLKSYKPVIGYSNIPKGCVSVFMSEAETMYVLEVPKSQFRVKLYDIPYENVGHPRLLFVVCFNQALHRVSKIACVSIKEDAVISESTELYHYPYSNVYTSGEVCWSDYPRTFESIHMLPSLFLSTMNNNHLCSDIRARYEQQENRPYDDNQLKPMNKLLKNLVN